MRIKNTVELIYLSLMLRWEKDAPPDKHQGLLDGELERNTQISRMAYLLRKIAAGTQERAYSSLASYSIRNDGNSYISKDASWMKEPYPLSHGWFLEGCANLSQKQAILHQLTKIGLSGTFVACADDFVAGKNIKKYFPTDDEQEEMLRAISALENNEGK